jgi:hypothetical protein
LSKLRESNPASGRHGGWKPERGIAVQASIPRKVGHTEWRIFPLDSSGESHYHGAVRRGGKLMHAGTRIRLKKIRRLIALGHVVAFAGLVDLHAERDAVLSTIVISVADQQLAAVVGNRVSATYPVSTSKFGVGDGAGSYKTPLGVLRITDKIGGSLLLGSVIKNRSATGEVVAPNAPGRDAIVSRILWLEGQETGNSNAGARGIYIHGTPEESRLGQPVSWGCIRMRSRDVAQLFDWVTEGTTVEIVNQPFATASLKSLGGRTCPTARIDPAKVAMSPRPLSRYRLFLNSNIGPIPPRFADIRWTAGVSGWTSAGLRFRVGEATGATLYPRFE